MKTISGDLVSVQTISLSKAARYISDFASFENNGVSDAVCIYLNHASEAFNSLVHLNKDLKHPQSSHKKQRKRSTSNKENDESMNYDDGERRIGRRDEKQDELVDDERVGVVKEDCGSMRISGIEDMRSTKKKRKEKIHKKDSVEAEDSVSNELRKGGENGDNVEVGNMVNQLVNLRYDNQKNGNHQEGLKDNSVEPTKKKKRSKVSHE